MKKKNKIGWMLMVLATVFFATTALTQVKEKQIIVERLQDIQNHESEFKIEIWVDREDCTYKIGDTVVFYFKSNRDCRLTLFNVATNGEVFIIFPNEFHKDNRLKAGETYRIPPEGAKFLFRVKGPTGEDIVKAIATLEDIQIISEEDVRQEEGFQVITKGEKTIAVELAETLKPVNPKKWAEAEKILKVVEKE